MSPSLTASLLGCFSVFSYGSCVLGWLINLGCFQGNCAEALGPSACPWWRQWHPHRRQHPSEVPSCCSACSGSLSLEFLIFKIMGTKWGLFWFPLTSQHFCSWSLLPPAALPEQIASEQAKAAAQEMLTWLQKGTVQSYCLIFFVPRPRLWPVNSVWISGLLGDHFSSSFLHLPREKHL